MQPIRRITPLQYRQAVFALFDEHVQPGFFDDAGQLDISGISRSGYSTEPELNIMTERGVEQLLIAAEDVAFQVSDQLEQLLPCAAEAEPGLACLRIFLDDVGARAFRRPLTADERALFESMFQETEGAFAQRMELIVAVMLQMPQFLYVVEAGVETNDNGVIQLTDYEVAQRLALLILDAPPDGELLEAAERGELGTPDAIEAQARRLLQAHPEASITQRFVEEWLHLDPELEKDAELFPAFDDELLEAFKAELSRVFSRVLREDQNLEAFLRLESAEVNDRLAEFYGMTDFVAGDDGWTTVDLPERHQGLVTRPYFLASQASKTASSHVFRGYTLLKRLFCTPTGSPPADALSRVPEYPAQTTARQKSLILRQLDDCSTCHEMMDPLGLSLENYDAIGQWRDLSPEAEGRQVIDASGVVSDFISRADVAGTSFEGAAGLTETLAQSEWVADCFVRHFFRYATGRLEQDEADHELIAEMAHRFRSNDQAIIELLIGFVRSSAFRTRQLAQGGM